MYFIFIISYIVQKPQMNQIVEGRNDFIYYYGASVTTHRCITEHKNLHESVLFFFFFLKKEVMRAYNQK